MNVRSEHGNGGLTVHEGGVSGAEVGGSRVRSDVWAAAAAEADAWEGEAVRQRRARREEEGG
eukprot:1229855-Rhodomonas_salina.1